MIISNSLKLSQTVSDGLMNVTNWKHIVKFSNFQDWFTMALRSL